MRKIAIKRRSEWNNRARKIGLYIDENKIGTIRNGEIKEFELEEGKHYIKAKIDWCGSQKIEFNLSDSHKGYFELSSFKYGNWLIPLFEGLVALYYMLKILLNEDVITFDPKCIFGLVLPILLYVLYHLTIGRNKYLRLKLKNKVD